MINLILSFKCVFFNLVLKPLLPPTYQLKRVCIKRIRYRFFRRISNLNTALWASQPSFGIGGISRFKFVSSAWGPTDAPIWDTLSTEITINEIALLDFWIAIIQNYHTDLQLGHKKSYSLKDLTAFRGHRSANLVRNFSFPSHVSALLPPNWKPKRRKQRLRGEFP